MDTLTTIERLKDLKPDWDSYGAERPDADTIKRAREILLYVRGELGPAYGEPAVKPIADPGVALIWEGRWHGGEVHLLVAQDSAEWVLVKNRQIADHGLVSDPQKFVQLLRRNVSL